MRKLTSAIGGWLDRLVRRWRCQHEWTHKRNIYGDEILAANARSVWVCCQCGKFQWRNELYYSPNTDIRRGVEQK